MADRAEVFVEKRYEVVEGNRTYYVVNQGGGSWHVGAVGNSQTQAMFTNYFTLPSGIPLKAAIKMLWKIARGQYTIEG